MAADIDPDRVIAPAHPLRRLYRRFHPIPRSPVPATEAHATSLRLVPKAQLTERFAWCLAYLKRKLGTAALGHYLEFGVYNGSSMGCLLEALRADPTPQMRLFGFDSFLGLPQDVGAVDGGVWRPGQFACPKVVTEENLKAAAGPVYERITLIEGWYKDTLATGDVYGIGRASLAMIDCDTYPSARDALEFLAPLLTDPAILIFDDWKLNDLDLRAMGEYRAFKEFLLDRPWHRAREVRAYNRKSKIFILTGVRR